MIRFPKVDPARTNSLSGDEAGSAGPSSTPSGHPPPAAAGEQARMGVLAGLPPRVGSPADGGSAARKRPREAAPASTEASFAVAAPVLRAPVIDPAIAAGFIARHLKNQDLVDMVTALDKQFSGYWAFTGSVALNIHAAELDGKIARPFHDADILIDRNNYQSFCARQLDEGKRNPAFLNPGLESGDRTHYKFKQMLVDFVCPDTDRKKIKDQIELVSNIPVRSLRFLIGSKKCDLGDSFQPERDKKARIDVPILERLLEKKAARDALDIAGAQAGSMQPAAGAPDLSPPEKLKRKLQF